MPKFKILTGNLEPAGSFESLRFERKDGTYHLKTHGMFGVNHDYKILPNIYSVVPLNQERQASFVGKAGAGALGLVALGGIGLFAGLLAGGNKNVVNCQIKVAPHYHFVAAIDTTAMYDLQERAKWNAERMELEADE